MKRERGGAEGGRQLACYIVLPNDTKRRSRDINMSYASLYERGDSSNILIGPSPQVRPNFPPID